MPDTGKERRERPSELAKRLGIQPYKPVYAKGKGVGMKKVDDGSYIDVGELPRALAKARKEGREELRDWLVEELEIERAAVEEAARQEDQGAEDRFEGRVHSLERVVARIDSLTKEGS